MAVSDVSSTIKYYLRCFYIHNLKLEKLLKQFALNKVALPVLDDELNPNFGYAEKYKLYSIYDHEVVNEDVISPPFQESELLPAWLREKGITDVITSGIDYTTVSIFSLHGINVHKGVQVKNCQDLIQEYIHGTLKTDDYVYLRPD